MLDPTVSDFVAMAATLFVVELADKDALLILALATRQRPVRVFLAGSVAFVLTSAVIVTLGAALITFVDVAWIRLAGGGVMLGYGGLLVWRIAGRGRAGDPGKGIKPTESTRRGFFAMVGSLALLDLAGDATEILIIVLLARYGDPLLVFSAACTGLIAAVAVETALGNTLGRVLTPIRLVYFSAVLFLALGAYILVTSL